MPMHFFKRLRWRLRMLGIRRAILRALRPARVLSLLSTLLPIGGTLGGCTYTGNALPQTTVTTTADAPTTAPESWQTLAPGFEQRVIQNERVGTLVVLRIDPQRYSFRAHYRPGAPLRADQWRETLPDAAAVVNANFFDRDNRITGLLIADGVVYGQSYQGFGGMLLVQNGAARVRSNILEPFAAGETAEQLVQAFPMLVVNGAASFSNPQGDRQTRRTVVAQDANGAILLIVTPTGGPTLVDFSRYLATSDLNLVNALNLDGGGSTMMSYTIPGTEEYLLPSLDPVPAVLAVYPR